MTEPASWGAVQQLARDVESAHFAGLVLTEMRQPPWLSVVAAHQAAPTLQLATGIAVAFPRSPMVMAQTAWELAEATGGRFRLGIGSQVRASIERRYGSEFAPPVARLRDYVASGAGVLGGVPRRAAAGPRRAVLPAQPAAAGRPSAPPRPRGPAHRHRRRQPRHGARPPERWPTGSTSTRSTRRTTCTAASCPRSRRGSGVRVDPSPTSTC